MNYKYALERRDEAFMVIENAAEVTQEMLEEYAYWSSEVGCYRNLERDHLWI